MHESRSEMDPAQREIVRLLSRRAPGQTICPSEAARSLGGEDFRAEMPTVREAARALAAAGLIEITQRGTVVQPQNIHGPIRLRLVRAPSD